MRQWWQDAVFYQIYPRSFADSNGDGIGDLRGIIGRLDYLATLGVEALWISPFFTSPQRDFGYDVADYRDVDPDYGSLEDARELIVEAHSRGIRVLLDLVVNHCSAEHPWFKAARASKEAPEHDWFIWKPLAGPLPNNWKCELELGPAWCPNPATGERYLATFTQFQPEFNWRNPELRTKIYDTMRFWYELGVDGYRLDVSTAYIKDEEFRSNPFSPNLVPDMFQRHIYDRNRPEVFEIFREMRAIGGDEKVLIGETHGRDPAMAAASYCEGEGLHLAFNFDLFDAPWDARAMRTTLERWYELLGPESWPVVTLSNHDRPRHAWRFRGRTKEETEGRARVAAALLLTLRGSPFLYYGEEIAMSCRRIPRAMLRDTLGIKTWPIGFIGRDPERTPMQWTSAAGAGFTTGRPWLPINPDYEERNVEAGLGDSSSTLARYRELIALRRATPELREGGLRFLDAGPGVLAYERFLEGGETLLVALNFASRSGALDISGDWEILIGEDGRERKLAACRLKLASLETLIAKRCRD